MPYIFVHSEMHEGNVRPMSEGTITYIDFHLSFDQVRSHLYRELQKVVQLNEFTRAPRYSQLGRQYDNVLSRPSRMGGIYRSESSGWKTYRTNVPAYVVLNVLETCDYKVVAASSTPIGSQYMWTLQGPVDREVDQAHSSSFHH